jgi:hypothetical protein
MQEGGSFQADGQMVQQLGYDPSRQWSKGDNPSKFLSLGDFQDSFKLENFDLNQIAQITGADIKSLGLDKLGVLPQQTLQSLVKAVPNLGNFPIDQVLPVKDLIGQTVGSFDASQTLNELLGQSPQLGNVSLANLDLSQYQIGDIPNLDVAQLGGFKDWQGVKIQEIPGLSDVPFSSFPGAPKAEGTAVGIVDVVFGAAEHSRTSSISGSTKVGFGVPCEEGCGHIELSGVSALGRQWVSGKYQEVKGGVGILAAVNGGMEPTGRHPFGEAFKLVVTDISEKEGKASLAMFFRFCSRGTVDLGCTPYFIGGVPLMEVREQNPIFLGRITNDKASEPSTPTEVALQELELSKQELAQKGNSSSALSSPSNSPSGSPTGHKGKGNPPCIVGAVDVESLTGAIASSTPGGFDALIKAASEQLDPTTGQPFIGARLIERVAQMQFGGIASVIDSNATDANGVSAKSFGQKIAQNYQALQRQKGC